MISNKTVSVMLTFSWICFSLLSGSIEATPAAVTRCDHCAIVLRDSNDYNNIIGPLDDLNLTAAELGIKRSEIS